MIEVFVLIYLSSGKCYTYIMCRVWLWVSVFLQAPKHTTHTHVQELQDTTRLQKHTHSEPHTTHNIGIALTTR